MMNARNDRYVVVDLEATSTGSKAKIIQVGIVVIENGEIIDQYATDATTRISALAATLAR